MSKNNIYDVIIIGGGAAGLFAGASLPKSQRALILEKSKSPGRKILLSGSSQCNLTHGGSIKEFLTHYGDHGKQIRAILYGFNNLKTVNFFEGLGVSCTERQDGKIFPASMRAGDVLDALLGACKGNHIEIRCKKNVAEISVDFTDPAPLNQDDGNCALVESQCLSAGDSEKQRIYTVRCSGERYSARALILATGGASYPGTGSDGSLFPVLQAMGIHVATPAPALIPINVHAYPYGELSGISFENVRISILPQTESAISKPKISRTRIDDLLFTHSSFSGPAILNSSRYAKSGDEIAIDYMPLFSEKEILDILKKQVAGNSRKAAGFLTDILNDMLLSRQVSSRKAFPKRFIELLCLRAGISAEEKASRLEGSQLKAFTLLLTCDRFKISGLGSFQNAMVTRGGIALDEVDFKRLSLKKYPGIHTAGEVLDIDGDTGGYNLQFAFSSGYFAAQQV